MEAFGEQLASSVQAPVMIALVGAMGAGKTHLTKGLVRGLGYDGEVTSPTFSLVQEYHTARGPIFHFDWYRLRSAEELLAIGWDDYLDQKGVMIVEWANLFPEFWAEPVWQIEVSHHEGARKILY